MTRLIARVNPMVLVIVGLASLCGSLAVRSLPIALITLAAYSVAAVLFVPRPRWVLVCLGFACLAALSVTYSTWRLGGRDVEIAVTAGLRMVVLAWPGSVAAGFIDPGRLGDYLAQFLPERGVVAFSAALQRFTTFSDTWTTLERSRRARGFGPSRRPLEVVRYSADMAFALIVQAMRDASRTSIAMDARGFASANQRSWAVLPTWSRLDAGALVLAIALGALPVVLLTL